MKKAFVIAAAISLAAAAPGHAQTGGGLTAPVCAAPTPSNAGQRAAQDACQQAYDVYQFMAPQLGAAIVGGNATLGQGSTLGGLGHFSVGVRVNAFRGDLPDVGTFTQRTSGATPAATLQTESRFVGLPAADVAVGIFAGFPLALTNVGGVDLLLSGTYVPTLQQNGVKITPERNVQLGYGARVGLLSESLVVPGVSFTYLKRDLPTTTISGAATYTSTVTGPTTATLAITDAKVNTSAWRVVASKSLLVFGLAAGVGQDKYEQSAAISATVQGTLPTPFTQTITVPATEQSMTRTNYFLDVSMNILLLKLTAEVGQVSGGKVDTFNAFQSGRADAARTYFAVGARLGI